MRRDAERNVLRVRNGLKHLAGVGRPQLTQTPKETVWSAEKVELWRYPSDRVRYRTPLLFVHSLVSRSYVFDLVPGNSFVETMLDRGFDVYLVDWGVPDELESGNTLETYTDGYLPTIVARGPAALRRRRTSTCSATASAACCRCSRWPATRTMPVRSLAVMATPIDTRHMGPMTSMMQDGPRRPRGPPRRHRQRARRRDAQLVPVLTPLADVTGYVNLWQHLWNDEFVAAHQVMTQWAPRPHPVPRRRLPARWPSC